MAKCATSAITLILSVWCGWTVIGVHSNWLGKLGDFASEFDSIFNDKPTGRSGKSNGHDYHRHGVTPAHPYNDTQLYSPAVFSPELYDYAQIAQDIDYVMSRYRRYVLPVNNERFYQSAHRTKGSPCENGEYDFVIAGTGTAGGVLATRLTEENWDVLALEAGEDSPVVSNMLGISVYLHHSGLNWGYNTTTQRYGCLGSRRHRCFYPRGHVVGGSSVINFGMYVRGNRLDFDKWASLGNPGWTYEEILPYFRKPEHATFTENIDEEYHGFDGPQRTGIPDEIPYMSQAIIEAHQQIGKPLVDYNGATQDGVSNLQFFLDRNIRASTAHAFIRPNRGRKNLKISTRSYVTKILIKDQTAYGVEYVRDGKTCRATARKEVILSAGAVNSPQILMLSGIGPSDELYRHGIEVIADLPVGRNLQDHLFFPGIFYRFPHSYYQQMSTRERVKRWTQNERPWTPSLGQSAISFFNFEGPQDSQPEIELFFFGPPIVSSDLAYIFGFDDAHIRAFGVLNPATDLCVNVELLHPRSRGTITLQSKDPRDFPVIDPNYFSDLEEKDIENMYLGVLASLSFNNTEAFRRNGAQLLVVPSPLCDGQFQQLSKAWWYCSLRATATTLFHPIGTTSMGPDASTSVVNHELKVHGIHRLRVVDAGIIPDHVSGHPNAAVVMIAEKAADMIKQEHLGLNSFGDDSFDFKVPDFKVPDFKFKVPDFK